MNEYVPLFRTVDAKPPEDSTVVEPIIHNSMAKDSLMASLARSRELPTRINGAPDLSHIGSRSTLLNRQG